MDSGKTGTTEQAEKTPLILELFDNNEYHHQATMMAANRVTEDVFMHPFPFPSVLICGIVRFFLPGFYGVSLSV